MSIELQQFNGKRQRRTGWQIFRAPACIGLLSCLGLLSALIGDGVFDGLSWLALSIPVWLSLRLGWWRPRG